MIGDVGESTAVKLKCVDCGAFVDSEYWYVDGRGPICVSCIESAATVEERLLGVERRLKALERKVGKAQLRTMRL